MLGRALDSSHSRLTTFSIKLASDWQNLSAGIHKQPSSQRSTATQMALEQFKNLGLARPGSAGVVGRARDEGISVINVLEDIHRVAHLRDVSVPR